MNVAAQNAMHLRIKRRFLSNSENLADAAKSVYKILVCCYQIKYIEFLRFFSILIEGIE